MRQFKVKDKTVSVFGVDGADAAEAPGAANELGGKSAPGGANMPGLPIVYLNTVQGEGKEVWEVCQKKGCPPFVLAAVSGLNWDHDMSPWAIPPIAPDDTPCTGGADEYLTLLTEELVPAVEGALAEKPSFRALAGYSLAGLFALYAAYNTDIFTGIASVSGSLWFPDFPEYVLSHEMKAPLARLYLSLGDKEAKTRNPYLKTVRENTEKLSEHFKGKGLRTVFELNPGNHFTQPNERTAAGIEWILKNM